MEERHSEEQSLEAWSHGAKDIDIGPIHFDHDDDEEAQGEGFNDEQLRAHQNGAHEDGDQSEAESDATADDDMMDRISSSPSIDDGAYINSSPVGSWPGRSSSLTPTRGTFNCSASSTSNSSPFLHSPMHLPLSAYQGNLLGTPPPTLQYFAPSEQAPAYQPLYADHCDISPLVSKDHHLHGEYAARNDLGLYDYETDTEEYASDSDDAKTPTRLSPRWFRHPLEREGEDWLTQIDGNNGEETGGTAMQPLLQHDFEAKPASPTGSSSSWSTISDASISANDNTKDPDIQDDDAEDFSFYQDERFVDSGWGGECLRDTEDIDFDFVYALHTFVATVEGQANAQKGDTMVLLDDSNSYWWLVRIVKDSSIGEKY